MKTILTLLLLSIISVCSGAELVYQGVPTIKFNSGLNGGESVTLNAEQRKQNEVVIGKNGDNYYWVTRNMKPMAKTQSGIYTYFIGQGGSGYVKINESTGEFLEHVSLGFLTITYHGNRK